MKCKYYNIKALFAVAVLMIVMVVPSRVMAKDKLAEKYGEPEVALGLKNVEEIAKQYKFITDPVYLDRVVKIGNKLSAQANIIEIPAIYGSSYLTPFKYQFNVIDSSDINAFSVMGGFIYVNKGMIDFCESDDELAGVIAHEIIHAAHHHLVSLVEEQSKINKQAMIAILVGVVASSGNAETIANVAMASNLYQIAMVNGYSQQAERDSDTGAVELMLKAGYNPVGLLTPMERLAQDPDYINLGIYRSHPITKERVASIKDMLRKFNIPILRSKVSGKLDLNYSAEESNGVKTYIIKLDGKVILKISDSSDEVALIRVKKVMDDLTAALKADLDFFDVKTTSSGVFVKNKLVMSVSEPEAALMGVSQKDAVQNIYSVIRNIILNRKKMTIVG